MVTKEQIKDWLDVDKKARLKQKIEEYIDDKIKESALRGQRRIFISTGRPDNVAGQPVETDFYNLWCSSEISRDNLLYVRTEIIKKYRQLGLIVKDRTFDEGPDSSFDGLQITIPSDF